MTKDSKGRTQPGYRQHVFICGHERAATAERPCCSARGSLDVLSKMKRAAEAADMPDVRVQKSGCLDFCETRSCGNLRKLMRLHLFKSLRA